MSRRLQCSLTIFFGIYRIVVIFIVACSIYIHICMCFVYTFVVNARVYFFNSLVNTYCCILAHAHLQRRQWTVFRLHDFFTEEKSVRLTKNTMTFITVICPMQIKHCFVIQLLIAVDFKFVDSNEPFLWYEANDSCERM